MTSVFLNEILFITVYVWPACAVTTLLLDGRRPARSRRRRLLRAALGPFGVLWALWDPYLGLPGSHLDAVPERAGQVLRRVRLHAPVLAVNLLLIAALLLSGTVILFHPGWTPAYFRLIQAHVVIGYASLVLFLCFVEVHLHKYYGGRAAGVGLALSIVLSGYVVALNEMNRRYLLSLPLAFAVLWLARRLRRTAGVKPGNLFFDSGLALLVILTFTYFTGVLIAEPAVSKLANNMALYLAYVHGAFVLMLLPLIASLTLHHLRIPTWRALKIAQWLGLPVAMVLLAVATVTVGRKWGAPPLEAGGHRYALVSTSPSPYASEPGATLSPEALEHNEEVRTCGQSGCHAEITAQWSQSAHRYAAGNLFYERVAEAFVAEKGQAALHYCQNCHDPTAALSPDRPAGESSEPIRASQGVTCVNCHTYHTVGGLDGNGIYTLREPAELPVDGWTPTWPWADAWSALTMLDIRLHLVNYSNTRLFESPEFCISCHRLSLPIGGDAAGANDLSNPYPSWAASSWAERDVQCRNCHMAQMTFDHRGFGVPDHRFPGMGLSLSSIVDATAPEREAVEELERFTAQWHRGEPDRLPMQRAPLLDVAIAHETVRDGIVVRVSSTNRQSGHAFPGGAPDIREVWLALEVRDAGQRLLFASGELDADGFLPRDAHRLGGRLVDAGGADVLFHHLWRAERLEDERVILPGETIVDEFHVPLDDTAQGPLQVTATWSFRRANQAFASWAFQDASIRLPVHALATAHGSIAIP